MTARAKPGMPIPGPQCHRARRKRVDPHPCYTPTTLGPQMAAQRPTGTAPDVSKGISMTTLTMVGLTPPALLTANHRLGWRRKARLTADIRSYGYIVATNSVINGAKFPGKVRVTAYLHFKDNRRRDPANWHPTLKPLIDGFVDAGLLLDDDAKHLVGPDIRIGDKNALGPTVDIHIEGAS